MMGWVWSVIEWWFPRLKKSLDVVVVNNYPDRVWQNLSSERRRLLDHLMLAIEKTGPIYYIVDIWVLVTEYSQTQFQNSSNENGSFQIYYEPRTLNHPDWENCMGCCESRDFTWKGKSYYEWMISHFVAFRDKYSLLLGARLRCASYHFGNDYDGEAKLGRFFLSAVGCTIIIYLDKPHTNFIMIKSGTVWGPTDNTDYFPNWRYRSFGLYPSEVELFWEETRQWIRLDKILDIHAPWFTNEIHLPITIHQ